MFIEIMTAPLQRGRCRVGLSAETQDEVARLVPAYADDLPQLLEIEKGHLGFNPAPADQATAGRDPFVMRPSVKFGA